MTLIETIIGVALFVMISTAIYFSYSNILDIIIASQLSSAGLTVMDNELEIIRNLPYDDIGVIGGSPAGILLAEKSVTFSGIPFTIKTTIRNIDDVFDGTIGGAPNDTAPADYKLVELELSCPSCQRFVPARVTTTVVPVALEISSNRGALFINVIDASGQPINQANVTLNNPQVSPSIGISDTTNNSGQLQFIDIATSSLAYEISVSKNGFSSERTYDSAELGGATPEKPHATVAEQQVTSITFTIDRLSGLNFKTQNYLCLPIAGFDFNLEGSKLIGTDPDVEKYSNSHSTNASGQVNLSNLEWDTYSVNFTDTAYDISGALPAFPIVVNPSITTDVLWNAELKNPAALLVSVSNQADQAVNDATVTISRVGFSATATSSHRFLSFSNWNAGQFSNRSSNIETENPAGQVHIFDFGSGYASQSDEWLESNTVDFGNSATIFHKITFSPVSQPAQTSLRIQVATNNDNATWNYVGPDGTSASYYTGSGTDLSVVHDNNRYLRYKIWLRTDDESVTPTLDDINFEFSSPCIVSGSSYFSGLANNTYTVTVTHPNYQTYSTPLNINSNWQEFRVLLLDL